MALPHESIVLRVEKHLKQLEGLEHRPEKRDLAVQLVGHIREGIACADVANKYHVRINQAFKRVTEPTPEVPDVVSELPEAADSAPVKVNGKAPDAGAGMVPQGDATPPPSVQL